MTDKEILLEYTLDDILACMARARADERAQWEEKYQIQCEYAANAKREQHAECVRLLRDMYGAHYFANRLEAHKP